MKKFFLLLFLIAFSESCRQSFEKTTSPITAESCIPYKTTKVTWDPHPDPTVAGFKLYRSDVEEDLSSFGLIHDVDDDPTATRIFLSQFQTPLNSCKCNYMYLTAYNEFGESAKSNTIWWGYGCPPDNEANKAAFRADLPEFIVTIK